MKVQILLPISIAVTVASFAFVKIRVKDVINEERKAKFQDVKLRVTGDVLKEYEKERKDTEQLMERQAIEQGKLEGEIAGLNANGKKTELDDCTTIKKTTVDKVGPLEEQLRTLEADSTKEKSAWEAEVAALRQTLAAPSPICNYIKPGSVHELCPNKEQPKAEEKNAEVPKPDKPKQEEPKPEEPKPEEPKEDTAKQEEPKLEVVKQDEPKPDAANL